MHGLPGSLVWLYSYFVIQTTFICCGISVSFSGGEQPACSQLQIISSHSMFFWINAVCGLTHNACDVYHITMAPHAW